MSPFAAVVVLILTGLFIILSVIPLIDSQAEQDPYQHTPGNKTKTAH